MRRRAFLKSGAALMAAAAMPVPLTADEKRGHDENLLVFFSDIHIDGKASSYEYGMFERQVEEVLALRPLPKHAIVFGDLARSFGPVEDYRRVKPLLDRLEAAGIVLTITAGNHDRRSSMFAVWPEYAKRTLVPGRFVTRVSTPAADFVLLDSLLGTDGRGERDQGPVGGGLDEAQQRWLAAELEGLKRPTFFGAHHAMGELKVLGKPLTKLLTAHPLVPGFIHGHEHYWKADNRAGSWRDRRKPLGTDGMRELGLPSTGCWGDIGYTLFRTDATVSYATLVQKDYYYPAPRPVGKRPAYWDAMRDEQNGRRFSFVMPGAPDA